MSWAMSAARRLAAALVGYGPLEKRSQVSAIQSSATCPALLCVKVQVW